MQKCLEQYSHSSSMPLSFLKILLHKLHVHTSAFTGAMSDAELRLPLWLRVPAPVLGLAPLGTAGHAEAVAELAIWLSLSQTVCRARDRDHYRDHSHRLSCGLRPVLDPVLVLCLSTWYNNKARPRPSPRQVRQGGLSLRLRLWLWPMAMLGRLSLSQDLSLRLGLPPRAKSTKSFYFTAVPQLRYRYIIIFMVCSLQLLQFPIYSFRFLPSALIRELCKNQKPSWLL